MYIFEVIDKTGRKIRLTKERWTHITSPESLHAYMANHLDKIEETVQFPDRVIVEDKRRVSMYKYYKLNNRFLRVLTKDLNGTGYIITSYFVRKIEQ